MIHILNLTLCVRIVFFFQIMKCSFSRPSPCFGKTVSRWYCIQNVQVCLHANILSYRQQYVLFMTLLSWNEQTSKCNIQIILSIYHKTPPSPDKFLLVFYHQVKITLTRLGYLLRGLFVASNRGIESMQSVSTGIKIAPKGC